jgi:hypothetical protein
MISRKCPLGSSQYTPRPPSLVLNFPGRRLNGSAQNGRSRSWIRPKISSNSGSLTGRHSAADLTGRGRRQSPEKHRLRPAQRETDQRVMGRAGRESRLRRLRTLACPVPGQSCGSTAQSCNRRYRPPATLQPAVAVPRSRGRRTEGASSYQETTSRIIFFIGGLFGGYGSSDLVVMLALLRLFETVVEVLPPGSPRLAVMERVTVEALADSERRARRVWSEFGQPSSPYAARSTPVAR